MNYGIALACAQHMASTQLAALGFVNPEVLSLIEDLIALTAPVEEVVAEEVVAEEVVAEEVVAEEGAGDAADQPV